MSDRRKRGERRDREDGDPASATTVPGRRIKKTLPLGMTAETFGRAPTAREDLTPPPVHHAVLTGESAAGSVLLDGEHLSEAAARGVLLAAFERAGLSIREDYPLRHGEVLVTLDGFDPAAGVGYQYLSHTDADVVTDYDTAAAIALKEADAAGIARVLVVHDVDTGTSDDLLARAEEFLLGLDLKPKSI